MWVSNFVATWRLHKMVHVLWYTWYLCTRSLKWCLNAQQKRITKADFIHIVFNYTQKVPQLDRLILKKKKHTDGQHRHSIWFSVFMTTYSSLLSKGVCTIPMGRLMCRASLASHSSSYQVPCTNNTQETNQTQDLFRYQAIKWFRSLTIRFVL